MPELTSEHELAGRHHRRCLKCKQDISAEAGFFQLTRWPAGDSFTLCSLDCLERFVRGIE